MFQAEKCCSLSNAPQVIAHVWYQNFCQELICNEAHETAHLYFSIFSSLLDSVYKFSVSFF